MKFNYNDFVNGYTMPFDYLWSWLVFSESKNFVMDLAELVQNSKIEITSYDNYSETSTSNTETRTVKSLDGDSRKDKTYTTTTTITYRNNTLQNALTLADVWIVKYSQEFTYQKNGKTNSYVSSPAKIEEKVDKDSDEPNFVNLFLKYGKVRNATSSASSWLFEILEENANTVEMVDLTKYLLYKATGTDYGVDEFDFSIFDPKKFKKVNSYDGGAGFIKEYIRYWEHSSPPPKSADGTCYIIESDGAGHPTVGYGVDIFNGGFATEFKQAGYPTSIGGAVPVEFVDALEDREIQECLEAIKTLTNGINLTGYQIAALVSRAYNCGVSGAVSTNRGSPSKNFVSSYNSYWNESDDQFEEKNLNANFNHQLYTNYLSKPVTSDGKFMLGLERRRKSEWVLFQTGYGDVINKWYADDKETDSRVGNIELDGENAKKMAQMLTEACRIADDDRYTYSKSNRMREYQYDCSSFVFRLYKEYFNINLPTNTEGYPSLSENYVGDYSSVTLQPGDVLYRDGHVELYLGNGNRVGAHTDDVDIPKQISVESNRGSFKSVYRFIK